MFAIVQTGGKQYKVAVGDYVKVEKLEAEIGSKVNLDALMVVDGETVITGNPIANKTVIAEVVDQGKERKVYVIKYKAKKHSGTKNGHRQPFTALKILEIK